MAETAEPRPAIFIDRDGTIIHDADYLSSVDELEIFDFARDALLMLREKGYLIIVISNQSGIGRGMFDTAAVNEIHREMNERLGGLIDAFYFCPHLPSDGCDCRKPAIGLVRRATEDFPIDIPNSWVIGDKKSDLELGSNAGIAAALVMTGYGEIELPKLERMPDLVTADLLSAAREISTRND
jgi:D-glycero-D-manno-heptose 1,7-bisphosphate phosphatase